MMGDDDERRRPPYPTTGARDEAIEQGIQDLQEHANSILRDDLYQLIKRVEATPRRLAGVAKSRASETSGPEIGDL